ncbi:lipopolysaccharide biosynthesis protein [Hyphomicrobium sp.]|uniref:lipopolysaccharide biosynthesis protein n=1 Tax=Hyphomicrobium sp. TaxID=82 RepID=UPI002D77137E|nr:oligosaccharide flippase family protein [Hyphomicrobium sp.]HET6388076.1 oligosaccharide flippase family protein [Hyphomicrobium sp.]
MILRHAVIYIGTRVFAAALNLLSVALFARLAGPESFGSYLLYLASAYIIYGFAFQWLRMSFFAVYTVDNSLAIAATFIRTVGLFVGLTAAIAVLTVWAGLFSADVVAGTTLPIIGLAVFETFYEIARARLKVNLIGFAVLLRAVLVPLCGAGLFALTGTATGLAAGVAAAHIAAAVPLIREGWSGIRARYSAGIARQYLKYGSPLILAFGINAFGQSGDRVLLGKLDSVGAVGPYGAVGDLIKQSLVVVSEAVAGSYMPHAKRAATDGDDQQTRSILSQAFRAYAFITAFGSAFILCFAPEVVKLLFGAHYADAAVSLVPYFTLATAFYVFRAFYFGQAIYFLESSSAELYASTATAAVGAATALALIPLYAATGAALAMLAAQAAGCFVAALAARRWRAMPLPVLDLCGIAGVALGTAAIADAAVLLPVSYGLALLIEFAVLSAGACAVIKIYDIFGLGDWVQKFVSRKLAALRPV